MTNLIAYTIVNTGALGHEQSGQFIHEGDIGEAMAIIKAKATDEYGDNWNAYIDIILPDLILEAAKRIQAERERQDVENYLNNFYPKSKHNLG